MIRSTAGGMLVKKQAGEMQTTIVRIKNSNEDKDKSQPPPSQIVRR